MEAETGYNRGGCFAISVIRELENLVLSDYDRECAVS